MLKIVAVSCLIVVFCAWVFLVAASAHAQRRITPAVTYGALSDGTLSDGEDTSQYCYDLYEFAYEAYHMQQWQQAYDSAKKFIEVCPYNPNAANAFDIVGTSLAHLPGSNTDLVRAQYLTWLESVMYLNTRDIGYWCSCLMQISGTLQRPADTLPGFVSRWTNLTLSVWYWMLNNSDCPKDGLWEDYKNSRRRQIEQWADNSLAYNLDTTVYTMQQLGLDTLLARHFHNYVPTGGGNFDGFISSISLTNNPTEGRTALIFTLTKETFVLAEVFDLLGNKIWSNGDGGMVIPGDHRYDLDLSREPQGTYYCRIRLGDGSVRTLKLVRE